MRREEGPLNVFPPVERFEMLQTIVQKCLDALPGEGKTLPNMEEARKKVTLYRRFLAVENSLQMEQFARSLTQEEQEALFEIIDKRLIRTFVQAIETILTCRDRLNGLLLSELGSYLDPIGQGGGTKRLSRRLA